MERRRPAPPGAEGGDAAATPLPVSFAFRARDGNAARRGCGPMTPGQLPQPGSGAPNGLASCGFAGAQRGSFAS